MVIEMETQTQNTTTGSLNDYANKENTRLETEAKEVLKELGFAEFFKMPEGQTLMEFADQAPRVNDKFANRVIFRVSVNGEEKDWSVNTRSPLYRDLVALISKGTRKVSITRVGQGIDTRYSVKAL
jgi:hypothetical protein